MKPHYPLRATQFEPHTDDRFAVDALHQRCRFGINAGGRVFIVFCYSRFSDADVDHLYRLPSLAIFDRLQFVGQQSGFTEQGFIAICRLPRLRCLLDQNDSRLTPACLEAAAENRQLFWLKLPNCGISDADVSHLRAATHLHSLVLSGNPISDASVSILQELIELRALLLDDTWVSDDAKLELKTRLPRLRLLK